MEHTTKKGGKSHKDDQTGLHGEGYKRNRVFVGVIKKRLREKLFLKTRLFDCKDSIRIREWMTLA